MSEDRFSDCLAVIPDYAERLVGNTAQEFEHFYRLTTAQLKRVLIVLFCLADTDEVEDMLGPDRGRKSSRLFGFSREFRFWYLGERATVR